MFVKRNARKWAQTILIFFAAYILSEDRKISYAYVLIIVNLSERSNSDLSLTWQSWVSSKHSTESTNLFKSQRDFSYLLSEIFCSRFFKVNRQRSDLRHLQKNLIVSWWLCESFRMFCKCEMSFELRRKNLRKRVTERESNEISRVINLLHDFFIIRRDESLNFNYNSIAIMNDLRAERSETSSLKSWINLSS